MRASRPFSETRNRMLKDPELAAIYLEDVLADGDIDLFKLALKHVADAQQGGLSGISEQAHLNRASLHKALSINGNPSLDTLSKLLNVVGLRFSVTPLGHELDEVVVVNDADDDYQEPNPVVQNRSESHAALV